MYKNKWFKRIVCMMMLLTLLIADIPITTFKNETTQAGGKKVNSGSKNTTAGDGHWGSTYKRTGWLVYYLHAHAPTDAGVTHAGR